MSSVGLSAFELDLRGYYHRPAALASALAEIDLVWITGGNVFVLRDALRRSRLDRLLIHRVTDGSLTYGGCSAGACVTGPTLRGLELVDDVRAVVRPIWDGLGFVDFCIAPHHGSAHPENEAMQEVVDYFWPMGSRTELSTTDRRSSSAMALPGSWTHSGRARWAVQPTGSQYRRTTERF